MKLTTAQPTRHPNPTTKALELSYLIFERPDLAKAEKFLTDFGLHTVARDSERLFLRGTSSAPFYYVVQKSNKPRFVDFGLGVGDIKDLEVLSRLPGASAVEPLTSPGGGYGVRSHTLQLELTVNGTVRQNDSTANLVHGSAETLAELASAHDLHIGDLIATGTPSGCALSAPSPAKQRIAALLPEAVKWRMFMKMQAERSQYLKAGDVVESRIATADGAIDLGVQRNHVVDEAA